MNAREPLRATVLAGITILAGCGTPGGSERSDGGGANAPAPGVAGDASALAWVEPEFLPALESLRAALAAGEDDTARLILVHVLARAPRGRTLEVAQGFERVLDGRAALRELAFRLEFVDEPDGTAPRDLLRLELVVQNRGSLPLACRPGPGTLHVEHERLDGRGALLVADQTKGFEKLAALRLEPGAEARELLSIVFLELTPGSIAERLRFRLELTSGTVEREGRTLPAMRFQIAPCERRALSEVVLARGPALLEHWTAFLAVPRPKCADALDLALRMQPEDHPAALEALARRAPELTDPDLEACVPALRWLSSRTDPGGDPAEWRRWLEELIRPRSKRGEHGLVLPPLPRGPIED